jgi:hypothetical protein
MANRYQLGEETHSGAVPVPLKESRQGLRHGSGSCREVVEAGEIVAAEARNRALLVARGARVHVGSLSGEDVPDRDEEAVSDRDGGSLRSPARDPFVEPAQVGQGCDGLPPLWCPQTSITRAIPGLY